MEKITAENFEDILKNKFPNFFPYWQSHFNYWGIFDEGGLSHKISPFSNYVLDVIKAHKEIEIKEIFDFVEYLLCEADESVQTAICTVFLEFLLSKDSAGEIKFMTFAKYLGKNSVEYCKAWDEFTGCKTKGLWG